MLIDHTKLRIFVGFYSYTQPLKTPTFRREKDAALLCPEMDARQALHTLTVSQTPARQDGEPCPDCHVVVVIRSLLTKSWCQLSQKIGWGQAVFLACVQCCPKGDALCGHSLPVPLAKEARLILFFVCLFSVFVCTILSNLQKFPLPRMRNLGGRKNPRTCQVIPWVPRSLEKLLPLFTCQNILMFVSCISFRVFRCKKQRGVGWNVSILSYLELETLIIF